MFRAGVVVRRRISLTTLGRSSGALLDIPPASRALHILCDPVQQMQPQV